MIHDNSFKYDYDTSKSAGLGDYFSTSLFKAYGLSYNISKNLVVRATTQLDTINFKYKFDTQNRIIELRVYNKQQLTFTDKYTYTNEVRN